MGGRPWCAVDRAQMESVATRQDCIQRSSKETTHDQHPSHTSNAADFSASFTRVRSRRALAIMDVRRLLRHLRSTHHAQRRAFPPAVTEVIANAVRYVERRHRVEVRFVVEGRLEPHLLLRRQTPRERARELFSTLGVWDTADNDGVLIYVLLADRAVEVVCDRGIAAAVPSSTWATICRRMEASFARRDFQHGALAAIRAVDKALGAAIQRDFAERSELPDQPLLL